MTTEHAYTLTLDLNALHHLGLNLYSNVPAVLSEVVANAWDADATTVDIKIDTSKKTITIADDGHGMTPKEANDFYLKVGYQRRLDERCRTPKYKRQVMGRKGIGKLALFSIADTIEVHSVKRGRGGRTTKAGFVMRRTDIEKAIERKVVYHPTVVAPEKIRHKKGTRIYLRNLKKGSKLQGPHLRSRLARRFSILAPQYTFSIRINDTKVTVKDRNYLKHIQYVWFLGDERTEYKRMCPHLEKSEVLSGDVDDALGYRVRGWIGTFDERKSIEPGNNTIVVLARGKLVQEDLLKDLSEGGIYTKYIIGEVDADFLDIDDADDILTSDRQRLKEDDPRLAKLREYMQRTVLKHIESKWTDWRTDQAEGRARKNQALDQWFLTLTGDKRKYARSLFQKIETLRIPDEAAKRELYKHAVLAFEKLVLKDNLSLIKRLNREEDFELLKQTFVGIDELEAFEYYHIVKGRLDVLKKLTHVAPMAKERVIQEHIFDHLWLLDPSWERASTNRRMEQRVTTEFGKVTAKLSKAEREGRLDIRYRTAAGKHIIVELKRYKVIVSATDLIDQVRKYRSALQKCLEANFPADRHSIEIICILGNAPTPKRELRENEAMLSSIDARFITYDTLIKQTQESYAEYLAKEEKVQRIVQLVERI